METDKANTGIHPPNVLRAAAAATVVLMAIAAMIGFWIGKSQGPKNPTNPPATYAAAAPTPTTQTTTVEELMRKWKQGAWKPTTTEQVAKHPTCLAMERYQHLQSLHTALNVNKTVRWAEFSQKAQVTEGQFEQAFRESARQYVKQLYVQELAHPPLHGCVELHTNEFRGKIDIFELVIQLLGREKLDSTRTIGVPTPQLRGLLANIVREEIVRTQNGDNPDSYSCVIADTIRKNQFTRAELRVTRKKYRQLINACKVEME